ncbi:MAG: GspH/FimT family pseudopilin [Gallionella sp.]|jgi:type IV fimbrial biogenesis protein FimT
MTTKRTQTGVTLMELMVVVAVAAIMALVAAPSFTGLINTTKQSSAASQLVADLNRARSESIKRNSRVLLCVRNTAGTNCGTGTNWQNGWMICQDSTNDNTNNCDASTTSNPSPIVTHQALDSRLTLTGSANLIQFNPNGTQGAAGAATLTLNGTWTGATAKTVSIAATGYISKN